MFEGMADLNPLTGVLSITGAIPICMSCEFTSSTPHSDWRHDELRTILAPLSSMMRLRRSMQDATKSSSPIRGWSTPSTSKKTTRYTSVAIGIATRHASFSEAPNASALVIHQVQLDRSRRGGR